VTVDLGEIFEEHKKFILGVAVAAVAFLVVDKIVADDAEATTRRADAIVRDLRRDEYPARSDLDRAAKTKRDLEARLDAAARKLAYAPAEGFEIPASARDADLQYNALFRRVREEVVDGAASLDIDVDPTLGLPEISPSRPEEISRYACALDLVRRVGLAAIDAGARSVRPISVSKASIAKFRASESFLEELAVSVRVTGSAESIGLLVETLSRPETFVAISSATISLEAKRRGPSAVVADLELVALHMSPDRPIQAATSRGGRR